MAITPSDANNRVFVFCDITATCLSNGDIVLDGRTAMNVGNSNGLANLNIHEELPVNAKLNKTLQIDDGSSHQGWILFDQLGNEPLDASP